MPSVPSDASSLEPVPDSSPRRAGGERAVSAPRPHSLLEVRRPGLLGSPGPGGALPSPRPAAAGEARGAIPALASTLFLSSLGADSFFSGLHGRMSRPRSCHGLGVVSFCCGNE